MLYPVAPEKIDAFKAKLCRASDAERIPHPSFSDLPVSDEGLLEHVSRFLEDVAIGEPLEEFRTIVYRGRTFALVEVEWPSPLRDLDGDMVLYTGNAPVGPDPMAMWQVLFLLPG